MANSNIRELTFPAAIADSRWEQPLCYTGYKGCAGPRVRAALEQKRPTLAAAADELTASLNGQYIIETTKMDADGAPPPMTGLQSR